MALGTIYEDPIYPIFYLLKGDYKGYNEDNLGFLCGLRELCVYLLVKLTDPPSSHK